MLFNPTEPSLFMASSGESKCEMIGSLSSQIGFSSQPNFFKSVDLPEPLYPTITPNLNLVGSVVGSSHG